jgi:16S rRNA processing protein RimM
LEELILVARIRRPHGVKGELLLELFTSSDDRFKSLDRLFLRPRVGEIIEVHIEHYRPSHLGILLKLKEIPDRTAAEKLNGSELLIPISERPKLPKGKVYVDEMVGMDVIDNDSGAKLGTVTNVLEMPAGNIVAFEKVGGGEHLITMAGAEVIKIDPVKKELRVALLEEYGERSPENS